MVPLTALWLPILLSAIVVFAVSAMVWMVMPHHKNDFARSDDEDALMDAVRRSGGPGMYMFPWAPDSDQNSEGYRERLLEGPVGILRVRDPQSVVDMKPAMAKSVLLHLVVALFVAYLAASTLEVGASYLSVFKVTGVAAFLAYGFIGFQESIWFGLPGKVAFKHALDGLVYALLTGGIFGWLWPM
ncbi:MAG: hypothetical protein OXL34_11800 [Gemmatimonadota bacterium]|nr:hypothetical protein [Gemmatimonadota bacterium]